MAGICQQREFIGTLKQIEGAKWKTAGHNARQLDEECNVVM